MSDDDLQQRKYRTLIQLIVMILMIIITCYSIVNGVGVFHESAINNITEHVVDKKIMSYNTFSSSGVKYYVFTDSYKFEMSLKDYNCVNVGDCVLITVTDFGDGTGHFNNDSFQYLSYGD